MPYLYRKGLPECKESGVYSITNKANGKVYVGSALSIRGRLLYHRSFLRRGKHDNSYLQRAWNKYGEESFHFAVLETCDEGLVIEREQHWIDTLGAADSSKGYNLCPFAGAGAMRGRKHSAETCARMSERQKGKVPIAATLAAAEANRGRKRSRESVEKSATGIRGQVRTEEQRANISASHWTKGPNADEIRARMAASLRGRTLSEEQKANISEGVRKRFARIPYKRRPSK